VAAQLYAVFELGGVLVRAVSSLHGFLVIEESAQRFPGVHLGEPLARITARLKSPQS